MEDITKRDAQPVEAGEGVSLRVPEQEARRRQRTWMERHAILLLGVVVILLSIALVGGGAFARSEINQQEDAAMGFQEEARLLAAERDGLSSDLEAALADVEDLQAQLVEQERLTSQAREEASREQAATAEVEEMMTILNQVVELDFEIQVQYDVMVESVFLMMDGVMYDDMDAVDAGYDGVMASASELDYLIGQRDALLAQLD